MSLLLFRCYTAISSVTASSRKLLTGIKTYQIQYDEKQIKDSIPPPPPFYALHHSAIRHAIACLCADIPMTAQFDVPAHGYGTDSHFFCKYKYQYQVFHVLEYVLSEALITITQALYQFGHCVVRQASIRTGTSKQTCTRV